MQRVGSTALDSLGEAGFDLVYGARPLKRALPQPLENPLAQRRLAGEFATVDTIAVEVVEGRLAFRKGVLAAA